VIKRCSQSRTKNVPCHQRAQLVLPSGGEEQKLTNRNFLEDEFWHRLECLGEPGGRSAKGCVQSDKQGRACNGSLDSNFEQTQRRGVGAFKLSDHRCCCLSFPTSGTRGPPAANSANKRECSNHSRKRKLAPFFQFFFFRPTRGRVSGVGL
jgi:hypothetical protein